MSKTASIEIPEHAMKDMGNTGDRRMEGSGVPCEAAYGYEQAGELGGAIYMSGQLSHTADGTFVALAPLDADGAPSRFANMECGLATYGNAIALLSRFGA